MRMGIGLGVGINRSNYAQGIFGAYATRVVADGGTTEAGQCVDAVTGLLLNASLLLIPSGYKGGKLYAEIPTNGNGDLTWTRGSDAFRTNASGLIQRVPCNLFGYSEQFDNGYWYKANSSITANTITAPNGTLTADSWIESNTNSFHVFGKSSLSLNSGSYVITIYAKAKERSKLIMLYTGTPNKGYGFDLANGTTSAVTGITSADSFSITNVGDGWYRCEIGVVSNSIGTVEFTMVTSFSVLSYLGDGTSGMYIWGAQLVEGTTAQTYLPTTDRLNFPRLSYMYGSCPSVLLEPQRTNSLPYSVGGGTGYSTAGTVASVTNNFAVSPDGTTTATRVNASAGVWRYRNESNSSLSGSTQYTFSIYVKSNTSGNQSFRLYLFNANFSSDLVATTSWQRFTFTSTSFAVVTQIHGIASDTLNNSADILTWGWQIEAGAYPTTYIPTTSATATRVADVANKTGISTLIGQSEGTIFVDFYVSGIGANNINIYNNERTPSTISTNAILFKPNGSIECQTFLGNGTFNTISITASTYSVGQRIKLAYRYKSGDFALYINGIQKATATNTLTFVGTKSQIYLDDNAVIYGYQEAVHYNQFALFTTALTNAELTQLTT